MHDILLRLVPILAGTPRSQYTDWLIVLLLALLAILMIIHVVVLMLIARRLKQLRNSRE